MAAIVTRNISLLNDEQRIIYDRVTLTGSAGKGGFFFFNAPCRTGKIFSHFTKFSSKYDQIMASL